MKNNSKVKQVIVLRKDLGMRKGKMISQGAHASLAVILNRGYSSERECEYRIVMTSPMKEWIEGSFAKIVLYVTSEQELLDLHQKAKDANIINALIIDSGLTEFHNVPTKTALAIGPDWENKIDLITGELPLL